MEDPEDDDDDNDDISFVVSVPSSSSSLDLEERMNIVVEPPAPGRRLVQQVVSTMNATNVVLKTMPWSRCPLYVE